MKGNAEQSFSADKIGACCTNIQKRCGEQGVVINDENFSVVLRYKNSPGAIACIRDGYRVSNACYDSLNPDIGETVNAEKLQN